ncbi:MAG: TolC family protein [Bacteroidales bacterium]|nr:TolC family protein [Bacteroidales bacterium]
MKSSKKLTEAILSLATLLFLFNCPAVFAGSLQDSDNVLHLSLRDLEQMAVERNNNLKSAAYDVQAAKANKWVAIANMLPQISATADYTDMLGYKMDLGQMQISMPANATLGVSASLAFNGAMVVNAKINEITAKMSDINLQKTELDIRSQAKQLYFSALVSERIISLLGQNVESMNSLYNMTAKSVEVGVSEQTAADQLAVQLATLKNSQASAERSLEMVYNAIKLLLDLEPTTELILTQPLEDILDDASYMALMGEDFNIENNYDYQLLQKNTELSKQQLNAAKWALSPTLSARYQYNYKHYFSDEARMNMTPPNMIGVTLSIPVFSSLGKTKTIQAAKYAYEKQLNTLNTTEKSILINYKQLCYNLTNAYENYCVQKENLDVTQKVFNNIKAKYEQGLSSAMEMTTTSNTLIAAQSAYMQSVMTLVEAQINLEKLLNK